MLSARVLVSKLKQFNHALILFYSFLFFARRLFETSRDVGVRIRGGLLTTTKNGEENKKRRETFIRILLRIREKEGKILIYYRLFHSFLSEK